jgi:thioredoxin-dependent peroxiredoxin
MSRFIKFKGNPMTLMGRNLKAGDNAPDFRVVSADLKETKLSDFNSKIKVITTFPSADTPVCDLQIKEFNRKAASFSPELVVLGISKDLPFAQQRFCHDNDIKQITLFSDYKYSSFGINYGLLIKELNLLARSILILDKSNIIRYMQIVEELSSAPDYEDALKNLENVVNNPAIATTEELPLSCKPCEGGVPALTKERVEILAAQSAGWQLVEGFTHGGKIVKEFKFKDFAEAKYFLDLVSIIAEEQGHHPTLTLIYNKLKITLTTHASGGLTENDFIMARIIDSLEG